MTTITKERIIDLGSYFAVAIGAGVFIAGGINHLVYNDAKDAVCDPITEELEGALNNSDLLDRLQNITGSGSINITIDYQSDGTEFGQLLIGGDESCERVQETIDLSK